ncbi:methyltransferase domain-containing protein [Methanospirillum purgamenti]|uniref:Methyltransferase domain-containing protein n=1 Tax=Methanospirillum hungatei TaxID=2203 RepID=A0A8F5ZGU1_METHU|nr:class I SAM-dependent methyltransferase [Methanospirillum hungatei]QXO93523.1 methyltransferase domain-containing protein [Methanospirillum hungatei]
MLDWTGERYLPYIDFWDVEIHYEHLHRYAFASHLVRGKDVLDLASGEGYGSYILAREASKVVGIDIDPESVRHAENRYFKANLEYIQGSICNVPIPGEGLFDVIVCFEAMEHIENHEQLVSEIKRLLKKDGLIIISTPNKQVYTDEPDYHNPFHVKELYFNEFKHLLKNYFSDVAFFGQRVLAGSLLWSLYPQGNFNAIDFKMKRDENSFNFTEDDNNIVYYVAIASNRDLGDLKSTRSCCIDISNTLISKKNAHIKQIQGDCDNRVQDYENRILGYESRVQDYENRILGYESRVQDYENRILGYENQVQEYEAHIQGYENQVQEYEAHIQGYENQVQEYEAHIQGYKNQVQEYEAHIQGYKNQVQEYEAHIQGYKNQVQEYEAHIQGYENQVQEYEAHIQGYKNQVQEYEVKITQLNQEREDQVSQLLQELSRFKDSIIWQLLVKLHNIRGNLNSKS